MTTGKKAATNAAKQLRRISSTPAKKSVAGSDLEQAKKKSTKAPTKAPAKKTKK